MFLSHAHIDAEDALSLANDLDIRLTKAGVADVAIFCTSKPEYSLPNPEDYMIPGAEWQKEYHIAVKELRGYLRENMITSQAYLLLVTPRSVEYSRPWIRWEMLEAQEMAKERGLRFIPCLLGVSASALRSMVTAPVSSEFAEMLAGKIPNSALHPYDFQAVDVSSPAGLDTLASALLMTQCR